MIFHLFILCYSSEWNSMHINVGCLVGRRIKQFDPVLITVYPFNFNSTNGKSSFYYDFGDGSTLVTDELYVHHVYLSSGQFILRVVRTDTATNISSDGSIDCYAQTIVYVFPHDSSFMFQLLSQDEINEEIKNENINQQINTLLNMHVIEIPLGKSTWYLRMIETTNSYYGDFITSLNKNLGRYGYLPSVITENEDLLHTIHYSQEYNCFEIEFNYIGTGMQSFTIRFDFNISIGSLLPLSTEYIGTTKIIKFSNVYKKGGYGLKDIKPIPYFPSGAVALNSEKHPVITNNNFYDWTEMDETVDDICASSSRVYFLKNGQLYYHELNSDEIKSSISTNNVIRGITITEFDQYKLYGSPRSSFRKADAIDAPDQILLFINSTMYRITGNNNGVPNSYNTIDVGNMTNILFASAYLDPHVTVIVYEKDNRYYRKKVDSIANKSEVQKIKIENLKHVFMHDFTKKMILINDSFVYLSSDLGISMEIVYLLQDNEIVINHASSLGYDEVMVYTSLGRAIMISPELGIATVLFTLPLHEANETPAFIYNYDDSLFVHINELTLRIPTESIIKDLTYSLPGGTTSKFWLEKDYGTILEFSILIQNNEGKITNQSKNSHYPKGFLPLDKFKYDLSHLSLYGSTEECRFISGTTRCEVLAFDKVIKQVLIGGSTWALNLESGRAQMKIASTYFDHTMIGMTISIPTIKLIFIIEEVLSASEVIGFIALDPDNFELTTIDSPRRFDFFRAIDIRNPIEFNSNDAKLSVIGTTSEGQKIVLNDINSKSLIYFNSSMVGMSLLINSDINQEEDSYFTILKVTDNNAAYIIKKKGYPRFLKEGVYTKWKITWDPILNVNSFLRKSWSLRYSWCSPISDPSFYYPIYSIRSMDSCRFDLNLSHYSLMNTRIVSNEQFSTISTVSPNNVSLSFTTPKDNYSLSSFVLSIRDSSPQCKHTYLLGISKMCSSNIRFIINFNNIQTIPIPQINYRAPSEHGMMIATSPYVYNVNLKIHNYNYKNKLKISQDNFNPSECSSSSKDINDMDESATSCLTTAYKVDYGLPIPVDFSLQEYRIIDWETHNNNFTIIVKEINGRKDICIAKKCQVNEREMKSSDEFFVTGNELYHFKFTVNITGCLYTKYAVFWCDQKLLSKSYVFLTMTIVLFLCVAILEFVYINVVDFQITKNK